MTAAKPTRSAFALYRMGGSGFAWGRDFWLGRFRVLISPHAVLLGSGFVLNG